MPRVLAGHRSEGHRHTASTASSTLTARRPGVPSPDALECAPTNRRAGNEGGYSHYGDFYTGTRATDALVGTRPVNGDARGSSGRRRLFVPDTTREWKKLPDIIDGCIYYQ